jgi:acyl-CoA synthetase (AMP-forming)/AMP-acid ligase II
MASDLDRKFDETLADVTGAGGRIVIDRDAEGRAIVSNFPATLPGLFRTFTALYPDIEAVVSGDERLTFPQLDTLSERLARALAARGIAKGDRVGIAMRNCPTWIVVYMAALKAGAIVTLLNGWWKSRELAHALELAGPALIVADGTRATQVRAANATGDIVALDIAEPVERALAPLLEAGDADLPEADPEDDATLLFTSGSTGESKGAVSTHRAVTTAVYTYATSLIVL